MDFGYVEFVKGSITNRNQIVAIDKAKLNGERCECYRSLFRFSEDFASYVEQKGSAAGYRGMHKADTLLFDFDYAADLEAVKDEVISFIESAEVHYDIPLEYWRLWWSGAKGFHASLSLKVCGDVRPADNFVDIYHAVCCELAGGFKYVDKSIYTLNRVIRMPGSINGKSGLFKIPLTFSEMQSLSIDAIKEIARHERTIEASPLAAIDVIPTMAGLWEMHSAHPRVTETAVPDVKSDFFSPAETGNRNNRALSICGFLMDRNFKENEAIAVLEVWNRANAEPLPEKELSNLVRGAYKRYGKTGGGGVVGLHSLADAENEYESIVDTPENEKVKFDLKSLDKRVRAFTPGMVCSIVAKSSNGKSSFAQSVILKHAKRSQKPVIFFSLEMPTSLVYERVLQSELNISGYEVEQEYKNHRQTVKKKAALIQTDLKNFFMCTKAGITIEEISETVRDFERRTGERVSLIAIDYLSLLGGKGKDIFEKTTVNAIALKQLAKTLSVPVIFLVQTTKGVTMFDELDQNAGKDSGSILEASDFQLVLWREKEDEMDMDLNEWIDFTMRLTKNRNGQQGATLKLRMNKISLRWEQRDDPPN